MGVEVKEHLKYNQKDDDGGGAPLEHTDEKLNEVGLPLIGDHPSTDALIVGEEQFAQPLRKMVPAQGELHQPVCHRGIRSRKVQETHAHRPGPLFGIFHSH
eukprot:CAMPEP_0206419236 /NCGR_PEP_ID=MMETSP0294-20121207/38487_1 /ASSEMBLY_ACC=CAM_ASM_000327 /TAXON_ID=39354 /ORGANISM="Heterosigma akashiwo, Strain CCMP2393" /LENGTH=100 /DNA_ID=CAMNT_0053882573 /DNA_START=1362 /DNA_END=1664 /DNA_ORIENTATION=+